MLNGQEIQRLRKSKHMTQADLAAEVGVTRGAVTNWENGRRTPNGKQVAAMARLFGVPLEQLWDGEPKRPFSELRTESDVLRAIVALVDIGADVSTAGKGDVTVALTFDPKSPLNNALLMLEDIVSLMDPPTNEEASQSNKAFLDQWLTKTLSKMERANDGDNDS